MMKQSPAGPQHTTAEKALSCSILKKGERGKDKRDDRRYLYSFLTKSLVGGMPSSASLTGS